MTVQARTHQTLPSPPVCMPSPPGDAPGGRPPEVRSSACAYVSRADCSACGAPATTQPSPMNSGGRSGGRPDEALEGMLGPAAAPASSWCCSWCETESMCGDHAVWCGDPCKRWCWSGLYEALSCLLVMRRSSVRFRQAAPRKAPGQELLSSPGASVIPGSNSWEPTRGPRVAWRRPRGSGRSGARTGPSSLPPTHGRTSAERPSDRRRSPATPTRKHRALATSETSTDRRPRAGLSG
jgi:hypothetical protein